MLRVEVVSANNIRRNYAWLTLEAAVNGTQALAPERKCSGTLGICEINKQFFVPQKHQTQDIVFVAKLYQVSRLPCPLAPSNAFPTRHRRRGRCWSSARRR